jgi:hypothetical protein
MTARLGTSLHGAFLLARGRPDGLLLLLAPPDGELATAARSFWAAALCLPPFVCLHLLDWLDGSASVHPIRAMLQDLTGYALGWVGFAVLSHALAGRIGRIELWPRFITAWNWCNVVQYLMLLAAAVPDVLQLPAELSQATWLVAMGWALWLEWYATRLTLALGGFAAAMLVATDFLLGVFLVVLTNGIG